MCETPAGPLHYATYFDRHYLSRGLALYRSLTRHSPPFVLWVLCLDDETRRTLAAMRLRGIVPIPLADLERADPALAAVRRGRRPVEYYWTCGPAFLVHLMVRHPHIDTLTYLSADLFFFGDPTPMYEELGTGAVLLVHHRWPPEAGRSGPIPPAVGTYNVGLLMFRRSASGLACLRFWRERCLEWCFDRIEPGRYGDQKYLDDWPSRFDGVVVSRHKGVGLAPWNLATYRYRYDDSTIWVDSDPLVFFHFQGLRVVTPWLYDPAWGRYAGETLPTPAARRRIYVPYVRELRAASRDIRAVGGVVTPRDSLRTDAYGLRLLAQLVRKRRFLLATDTFAL